MLVLDREAQESPSVVARRPSCTNAGLRVRTLSLFYEEWLGMLPLTELERVSLLFDIGEVHRAQYGRLKRMVDLVLGLDRPVGVGHGGPVRDHRRSRRESWSAASIANRVSARTARCSGS